MNEAPPRASAISIPALPISRFVVSDLYDQLIPGALGQRFLDCGVCCVATLLLPIPCVSCYLFASSFPVEVLEVDNQSRTIMLSVEQGLPVFGCRSKALVKDWPLDDFKGAEIMTGLNSDMRTILYFDKHPNHELKAMSHPILPQKAEERRNLVAALNNLPGVNLPQWKEAVRKNSTQSRGSRSARKKPDSKKKEAWDAERLETLSETSDQHEVMTQSDSSRYRYTGGGRMRVGTGSQNSSVYSEEKEVV